MLWLGKLIPKESAVYHALVCLLCNVAYGLNTAVNQLASILVMPTLLTFASQKLPTDVGAKETEAFARIEVADESHACDRESVLAQIFAITLRREASQEELVGQLIAQFLGNVIAMHARAVLFRVSAMQQPWQDE